MLLLRDSGGSGLISHLEVREGYSNVQGQLYSPQLLQGNITFAALIHMLMHRKAVQLQVFVT